MSLLQIENANAYYGDFQALYDINLEINEGDVFACIGANGAGKSTMLKMISGSVVPREGRVLFDGRPIDHVPPHKRVEMGIATVPEGRQIFPSLTVHENLLIGAYRGRKGPWTTDAIYELFPLLVPLAKRQASALSGGEQQSVAIGRALMANPRLILMDEVSLGLAPVIIKRIYDAFPRILGTGCTILVVEQDVQHVLTVAKHVACFLAGRIALQGTPDELTTEQITAAYFGV
ncbi:MAG: ABC transporter ATP-binding protein [Thermoleophilia bacterium]|jgi:branched-chain amino acid transport system ATP-binding protein